MRALCPLGALVVRVGDFQKKLQLYKSTTIEIAMTSNFKTNTQRDTNPFRLTKRLL